MFKNIVRAISPFTKRSPSISSSIGDDDNNTDNNSYSSSQSKRSKDRKKNKKRDSTTKLSDTEKKCHQIQEYKWNLDNVDFKRSITLFYQMYNPEKVKSIDFILDQYSGEGERIEMLRQLCELYDVNEKNMEKYIAKGKIKKNKQDKLIDIDNNKNIGNIEIKQNKDIINEENIIDIKINNNNNIENNKSKPQQPRPPPPKPPPPPPKQTQQKPLENVIFTPLPISPSSNQQNETNDFITTAPHQISLDYSPIKSPIKQEINENNIISNTILHQSKSPISPYKMIDTNGSTLRKANLSPTKSTTKSENNLINSPTIMPKLNISNLFNKQENMEVVEPAIEIKNVSENLIADYLERDKQNTRDELEKTNKQNEEMLKLLMQKDNEQLEIKNLNNSKQVNDESKIEFEKLQLLIDNLTFDLQESKNTSAILNKQNEDYRLLLAAKDNNISIKDRQKLEDDKIYNLQIDTLKDELSKTIASLDTIKIDISEIMNLLEMVALSPNDTRDVLESYLLKYGHRYNEYKRIITALQNSKNDYIDNNLNINDLQINTPEIKEEVDLNVNPFSPSPSEKEQLNRIHHNFKNLNQAKDKKSQNDFIRSLSPISKPLKEQINEVNNIQIKSNTNINPTKIRPNVSSSQSSHHSQLQPPDNHFNIVDQVVESQYELIKKYYDQDISKVYFN
jgi:hypothetical protein